MRSDDVKGKAGVVISAPTLFQVARQAALCCPTSAQSRDFAPGLTAVVFAAASLEALASEVAELADLEVRSGSTDEALQAFAEATLEAERGRGSIHLKFIVASTVLIGQPYRRGSQPYQDFAVLMNLRNAIMHLRPTALFFDERGDWQLGVESVLRELQVRRLITPPPPKTVISLLELASRRPVARWAVNTAVGMAQSFISLFPESFRSDVLTDQAEAFRRLDDAGTS
jgi:hypothetical protein